MKRFLTVQEIAQLLSLSQRKVRSAIQEGSLKSVKAGHSIRVPISALSAWLGMTQSEIAETLFFTEEHSNNENR